MQHEPVKGFSATPVHALRYNSSSADPFESTGLMMAMIPNGSRVLDIGCGTGSISRLIQDTCSAKVLGIEPNADRAKAAGENGIEVIDGIYNKDIIINFEKFDVIILADVLEHLVDPSNLLDEIKFSLKKDGIVLASIPNVAHWTVRIKLLFGIFDYKPTGIMDATHLRWFTRKTVRQLFEVSGYRVIHLKGAAGAWLNVYRFTPLRLVPRSYRSKILSLFCSLAPNLFAVQHVAVAKVA